MSSVDCPGDVKAAKGKSFTCEATATDGTKATINVKQASDKGDVRINAPLLHTGAAEQFIAESIRGRKLLAFTDQQRCDESDENYPCPPGRHSGNVVDATIWRAATRGHCPSSFAGGDSRRSGHCAPVATAHGRLTVLDVDAGRIAARTDRVVRIPYAPFLPARVLGFRSTVRFICRKGAPKSPLGTTTGTDA